METQKIERYQRYLTQFSKSFDPLELAKETESIVCRDDERKYTSFYATGVYGGIATGYTVGCLLRCIYCWVDWSRDFPEAMGEFYSPNEVFDKLRNVALRAGVRKMRISNAEPTIGREHLLGLLSYVEKCDDIKLFILETNGILFGIDTDYVDAVSKFSKVHVRVSIKAAYAEEFKRRCGASSGVDLPFQALRNLKSANASFHVAAMTDSSIMSQEERLYLLKKLAEIDKKLAQSLEEEVIDPYDTTLARLKYAGVIK